jgi:hypothetical protein
MPVTYGQIITTTFQNLEGEVTLELKTSITAMTVKSVLSEKSSFQFTSTGKGLTMGLITGPMNGNFDRFYIRA